MPDGIQLHRQSFGYECEGPELRVADHQPAAPTLPHREAGELRMVLYVTVDQVAQPGGQRGEQEHAAQTNRVRYIYVVGFYIIKAIYCS